MRVNRSLGLLGQALSLFASDIVMPMPRGRSAPRRQRRTTRHATNGKRECGRRVRQIASGALRAENGVG